MADNNDLQRQSDFLVIEAKVKKTYGLIQEAKDKLKEQREMFKAAFENDPVFHDHEAKYEEARGLRLTTRQQILKDPAVASMQEKIKEMSLSLKELQASLSEDLQQYQRLTGEKVIETDDGRLMEIVNNARLVKRS